MDSSFWFAHLVSTVATAAVLAILAALATRLLAVAAALAGLDEVTHRGIKVGRNAAANAVDTTRRDAYDTLGGIRNRTRSVRRGHRRVSKGAPETTY